MDITSGTSASNRILLDVESAINGRITMQEWIRSRTAFQTDMIEITIELSTPTRVGNKFNYLMEARSGYILYYITRAIDSKATTALYRCTESALVAVSWSCTKQENNATAQRLMT